MAPYELLTPALPPAPGTDAFAQRMQAVGRQLRSAQVGAIYLVHGTLVGTDPGGWYAGLAHTAPRATAWLRRTTKRLIDHHAGDTANYTADYAKKLEQALSSSATRTASQGETMGTKHIPVRRFFWSGENNHIGRALAAVRLIDEIASRRFAPNERVLIWSHSHGGNALALMSHLLAADQALLDRFFQAIEVYRGRSALVDDRDVWGRVRGLLSRPRAYGNGFSFLQRPSAEGGTVNDRARTALDVVTFGTPIRYAWNPDGIDPLLHFVNHRPIQGTPHYRSAKPSGIGDILRGVGGDYVQRVGIGGTNFLPAPWCWRAWLADLHLGKLIAPEERWHHLVRRVESGRRVAHSGTTLLVDYGSESSRWIRHFAGHADYTRTEWMLFHAEEVARRFYQDPG